MRDGVLRRQKDRLLTPLAGEWAAAIHPNVISVAAMAIGLLAAGAIWQEAYGWGLLFWLLNRTLDGLDGVVARVHHKQSDFGGYLDLILDFVVYLAVPIAFAAATPTPWILWATVALLVAYVMNLLSWSVLSAILEKRRADAHSPATPARLTTVTMPAGLIEGAETIIFYTLFMLLPAYVGGLFLVMAVLVLVTAMQRVVWAYRNLKE